MEIRNQMWCGERPEENPCTGDIRLKYESGDLILVFDQREKLVQILHFHTLAWERI